MFDSVVVDELRWADDDPRPEEAVWPDPWFDGSAPPPAPPVPSLAEAGPSGWSALELDQGTVDPAALSDADVVEAIVGFDRVASWAMARQARLLAELTRRRPADAVPNADRANVGSRFVPDEVGVALRLARGTAARRIGTACRLLAVLPGHDTALVDELARAVDDQDVDRPVMGGHRNSPGDRGVCRTMSPQWDCTGIA